MCVIFRVKWIWNFFSVFFCWKIRQRYTTAKGRA